MKKRMMKLVGLVLIGSLCAGCNGGVQKVQGSAGMTQEQEQEVMDKVKAFDGPSWLSNKDEPVTLEWFVGYDWAVHNFKPDVNLFDKYLLEELGIKIEWSIGSQEKLNMLIATGKLPDIITYDIKASERLTMENNNMLYPLNELRDKYAPDLSVPESMVKWYENKNDGNWYAFANFYYGEERLGDFGGYLVSHNMNYARADIMEQLGIDPASMNTKKGFIEALKKVKAANVQYNGKTVEPYGSMDLVNIAEQFGLDREDKDGNLLNIMRQPEYKEALLFLNEMYTEGLMTDEMFTIDPNIRKQKFTNGEVFAATNHAYANGRAERYYQDAEAFMVATGFIQGDEGKKAYVTPSPTGGWTGTMISKNCENPDRAIQLFAFLSQEEQVLRSEFGGMDGYDLIDGKAYIKDERLQEKMNDPTAYASKYECAPVGYFIDYTIRQKYEPEHTGSDKYILDEARQVKEYFEGATYDDKLFSNVLPEGGTEMAAIQSRVGEYSGQQIPQIIMAETPQKAEELYDKMMKELDAMGMETLDDYKNERFLENKKKVGVDLAWPRNF